MPKRWKPAFLILEEDIRKAIGFLDWTDPRFAAGLGVPGVALGYAVKSGARTQG